MNKRIIAVAISVILVIVCVLLAYYFILKYKDIIGQNKVDTSEEDSDSTTNIATENNNTSAKRKLESYIDISKTEYLTLNNTDVYYLIPNNPNDLTYYYLGKIMLNGEELEVTYYKNGLRAELIFFKDKVEKGSLYVGELNGPNYGDDEEYEKIHKDLPDFGVNTISIYKSKYLVTLMQDEPGNSLTWFDILDNNFQVVGTFSTDSCYWQSCNVSDDILVKITDDEFTYSNNERIDERDIYTRVVYRIDENNGVFTSTIIKIDPENTVGPAGQS
jgi:hypothetical protein